MKYQGIHRIATKKGGKLVLTEQLKELWGNDVKNLSDCFGDKYERIKISTNGTQFAIKKEASE